MCELLSRLICLPNSVSLLLLCNFQLKKCNLFKNLVSLILVLFNWYDQDILKYVSFSDFILLIHKIIVTSPCQWSLENAVFLADG